MDRHCADGNHWAPIEAFGRIGNRYARDCRACLGRRSEAAKKIIWMRTTRFDGVDIDAIHFKLGAVKPGVKPRP
jgi:hypothetical protein